MKKTVEVLAFAVAFIGVCLIGTSIAWLVFTYSPLWLSVSVLCGACFLLGVLLRYQ